MDPSSTWSARAPSSNLRSRGDGPKLDGIQAGAENKPPLTRRWTLVSHRRLAGGHQTSAHAEMDLKKIHLISSGNTNLRSRGDGPIRWRRRIRPASKPPLTRRWTPYPGQPAGLGAQTSAHAEMDRDIVCSTAHMMANLRSRGDGPPRQSGQAVPCYKPPLTRRWTQPRRGFVLR